MQIEVGYGVSDVVRVVFGVVSSQKAPRSLAISAVNVPYLFGRLVFAQNNDLRFEVFLHEGSALPHKAVNNPAVVLCKHRRNPIPLGRKVKKHEKVVLFVELPRTRRRNINVGHLVGVWICNYVKIFERKAVGIVQFGLCIGVYGVAVKHTLANIHPFGCKGYVKRIGGRTHCKHKSSSQNKISYLFDYRKFELGYFLEAEAVCSLGLGAYIVNVPLLIAILRPEFAELSRKVFVVKVQPVV